MMHRRTLLRGLIGVIAAPAIVRATSIMPVKGWVEPYELAVGDEIIGATSGAQARINAYRSAIVHHIELQHGEGIDRLWELQCSNDLKFYEGLRWRPSVLAQLKAPA